jgi:hypothetical protein
VQELSRPGFKGRLSRQLEEMISNIQVYIFSLTASARLKGRMSRQSEGLISNIQIYFVFLIASERRNG